MQLPSNLTCYRCVTKPHYIIHNEEQILHCYLLGSIQSGRVSVKMTALDLEHMLVNWSIQTGRVASKKLYKRDAVVLTLARPV